MNKLKKNRVKWIGCVIFAVVLLICVNCLYKNRRVYFEDDKMRQVICLELGKDKDSRNITYYDLDKIEKLEVGPVGEFETIIDVEKCKNLKELRVNVEIIEGDAGYELFQKTQDGLMYYPPVDKEKIICVQEDLEKILKKLKKLEIFGFTNVNESCNITNFEFLTNAKNLKKIDISYGNVEDYSVLESCYKVKIVDLWYSNIENADVLLKLKYVDKFILTGTPLAENEEEISRLEKAFPEAKIVVD